MQTESLQSIARKPRRWIPPWIFGVSCLLSGNLARGFPVITAVSPTFGAPGTSVDIQGSDLSQTLEGPVWFGSAIFTVVSANEVVATVPLDATSGPVSITATSGVAVTFGNFLVPPRITEISPDQRAPRAVILISGANFEGATAVVFNGTNSREFRGDPVQPRFKRSCRLEPRRARSASRLPFGTAISRRFSWS